MFIINNVYWKVSLHQQEVKVITNRVDRTMKMFETSRDVIDDVMADVEEYELKTRLDGILGKYNRVCEDREKVRVLPI